MLHLVDWLPQGLLLQLQGLKKCPQRPIVAAMKLLSLLSILESLLESVYVRLSVHLMIDYISIYSLLTLVFPFFPLSLGRPSAATFDVV